MARASTIAAIATATGGAIGIVRLSGPDAEAIAARLFRPWPATVESHRLYYGRVHRQDGQLLDEVMLVVMRPPRSFTGELAVEIQAHGGRLVLQQILAAAVEEGATRAAPGEFTRRAFVAGRIDLTRAEAVAQLVGAESDAALAAARAMSGGALARRVGEARRHVVETLAELEGALDFPEDELQPRPLGELQSGLARVAEDLWALAKSYQKHLWASAEVLIVGRSNAGKSSLFNALCGEERALVDEAPGTTRDLISSPLRLEEWSVLLTDSAGRRDEPDRLEQRGIALGSERLGRADVAVLVVDGERGWGELEAALWQELPRRRIVVWNKADRAAFAPERLPEQLLTAAALPAVASRGEGADAIRAAIAAALRDGVAPGAVAVSERQAEALAIAAERVREAVDALAQPGVEEVAAVACRRALATLGRVTGETADEEILDAIFARFCIGK